MIQNATQLLAQAVPPVKEEYSGFMDFFPVQASPYAYRSDNLYMFIFWVSTFFFTVIIALMCYFVVKYRRQPGVKPLPSASHNTTLEILWSVLPSIILVYIFYEGATGYYEMRIAPDNAEEIQVEASQFSWKFTYPDGDISNELHLVQDRPVKLIMHSKDVLHSFFIAAFRQKMDVVPKRFTYTFLNPNRLGTYRVSCTEYCGDNHSRMRTICVVHPDDQDRKEKTKWISADHSPWINGERIYKINCAGCHNVNGVAGTGPALNLIWGIEETLIDGSTVKVDENYVAESLKAPNAKIVKGFGPVSKMQSFEGKLSDKDVNDLISFIKLKDQMSSPPPDKGALAGEDKAGADANVPAPDPQALQSNPAENATNPAENATNPAENATNAPKGTDNSATADSSGETKSSETGGETKTDGSATNGGTADGGAVNESKI